jgi:putative transcriptional regulator
VIKIPNLVKQYRKENKMTQREVAEKVRVTERTIISVEKGKYKPSIVLAYKLAKLFGTDIETLFCLKEFVENEEE